MDAAVFLSRVAPLDRWTYIVLCFSEDGKKRWVTRAVQGAADAAKIGAWGSRKGADVYFALASYAAQGRVADSGKLLSMRTQENAVALKSLWLDVDYNKGAYTSKEQALAALGAMVTSAGLPKPNLIVSSGNGFHVYWTLDAPLPKERWALLARALASAARAAGLQCDLQCTVDAARILRLPGTLNRKDPAQPKPVSVVGYNVVDVPVATLEAALASHAVAAQPALQAGTQSDLAAGVEQLRQPSFVAHIVENCGVFARIAETRGAEGTYEHWRSMLNVLPYTEDGDAWVHRLSEGHRTYTADTTNKHYEYAKANKAKHGPTECATLMAHPEFAAICQRCPHLGVVKTPWSVGHAKLADLPHGYLRDGKAIYRMGVDDEGNPKRLLVLRGDIVDFRVSALAADEYEDQDLAVAFTYVAPTGRRYPALMRFSELPDNRAASQRFFAARGVTLDPLAAAHFRELIMSWTQTLRDSRKEQHGAIKAYGWHEMDGKHGFAYYDRITLEDGAERPVTAIDRALRKIYQPKGAVLEWRDTAQFFLDHSQPALRVLVASSFAAPLVSLSGMSGLLLSVVSTKSGAGKSTALRVAQSVWGAEQGVNALNDTPLSVQHKMGVLKSLPVFWDEIRGQKNVEQFVATVFQLSQGKDRSRLTQTVETRETGHWATMLVCASNNSILDTMAAEQGGTDAGFLRTFEIEATLGATDVRHIDMENAMMKLRDHYGVAGRAYAQFIAKNRSTIAAAIVTEKARLDKLTMATPDERFWLATMAVLLVGAALATASGVLRFDVPSLRAFLMDCFAKLRRQRSEETFASSTDNDSMVDVLNRFLYDHSHERLITDHCSTHGRFAGPGRMVAPKSERVAYHIATESKVLRVPRTTLRKWLAKNQIPRKKWVDEAAKQLGVTTLFSKLAAGTPYASLGQIWCYDFPLSSALLSQVADAAADALTSAGSADPAQTHGSQPATGS